MTQEKRTVVLDIETNALINPSKVWVVVCKEVESKDDYIFIRPDLDSRSLVSYLHSCTTIVGHNILGYDLPILRRLVSNSLLLPSTKVLDTLILSRMCWYSIPNGHSLGAWGERLAFPKGGEQDWTRLSNDMIQYCRQDVALTEKLFLLIRDEKNYLQFKDAVSVEHTFALICQDIHTNGFNFDIELASCIHEEIYDRVGVLAEELQFAFPLQSKLVREITPIVTKYGTLHKKDFRWLGSEPDLTSFTEGASFSLLDWVKFKPSSPKQIVERLNQAGWKPTEKTKTHLLREKEKHTDLSYFKEFGWKVSEKNLATLPEDAPRATQKLVEYIILNSRRSTLHEWFQAYRPSSGKVHGTINPIGTWPHRVSHRSPNMGNIPSEKSVKYNNKNHVTMVLRYGRLMRSCWHPGAGNWEVGCDMESAHLRILAHLTNDPTMIEAVTTGDKDLQTTIHYKNMEALGPICTNVQASKTFIYSFINGAGISKIQEILDCTHSEAKEARANFYEFYPGLVEFRDKVLPEDVKRGYIYALDGRPIIFPSPHTIIAAYLLSGEAVIMKHANVLWYDRLTKEGINFKQLNMIHDEWQTAVRKDRTDGGTILAKYVGQIQADSIRTIGEKFGLNCPMKGEYKIGRIWYETH